MSTDYYTKKFADAIDMLASDIVPPATELAVFEREAAEAKEQGRPYPPSYYRTRRDKILERVAYGESRARAAYAAARDEAIKDAREIRAAAEANRDQTQRVADEMERARLVGQQGVSADDLAQQAADALKAGQPRRAEFLLSVAEEKGYRGGVELDEFGNPVSTLTLLRVGIQDSIDAKEPERKRARSIEATATAAADVFAQQRKVLLARHGIGTRDDGSIGSAQPGEAARASIGAKVSAAMESSWGGGVGEYRAPDGLLPSAPTGDYVRAKE